VRSQRPKKIVLATALVSEDVAEELRPLVDELVVLFIPQNMYSIGQFYQNFPQITDEEVIKILHEKNGQSLGLSA
jgi:putative phosphoribosyl transferase